MVMKLEPFPLPSAALSLLIVAGSARADDVIVGAGLDGAEVGPVLMEGGFFGDDGDEQEVCKFPGNTDPVDLASGEFHLGRIDLVLPGRIAPLPIGFTYRSQRMCNGRWGFGWYFPYEMRIHPRADGTFTWRLGTGEELVISTEVVPLNHHVVFEIVGGGYRITDEQTMEQFEFTPEGLLETWRDTADNEVRFEWELDVRGAPVKSPISGRAGNAIALDYRISRIVGTLDERTGGQFVDFLYYDSGPRNGRLKELSDSYGRVVQYDYDDDGNLTLVKSPTTEYEDETGALVTRPRETVYEYSSGFRLDEVGVPEHPLDHNLTRVVDDRGAVPLENVYDTSDRVVAQTQHGSTSTISYLAGAVDVAVEIDGNGFEHRHEFDPATGLRTKLRTRNEGFHGNSGTYYETVVAYNQAGEAELTTLPNGQIAIETAFDGFGNVVKYELRDVGGSSGDDVTYDFLYETVYNRIKKETDPFGNEIEYVYDHEEAKAGDLNGDGRTDQDNGRVILISYPDATLPDSTVQTGIVWTLQYNDNGQVIAVISPEGTVVEYAYFASGPDLGLLEETVVDPGGEAITTSFTYDSFGYVSTVTNPRGKVTTLTNNAFGEVRQIEAPENVVVRHRYDGVGNLVLREVRNVDHDGTVQTPEWIATRFDYDAWNRLTEVTEDVTDSTTRVTELSYDGLGQVTEVVTPEGRRNLFAYDERGMLYRATFGYGTAEEATWQIAYDRNGNVKSQTDPEGRKTTWAYDDHDRLDTVTDDEGNVVDCSFNRRLELVELDVIDAVEGAIQRQSFTYDELGRRTVLTQSDPASPTTERSVSWFYRRDGLLGTFEGARSQETTFEYDTASRLERVTDPVANVMEYALDSNGNPIAVTTTEVAAAGDETYVIDVVYDDLDRPEQVTRNERGGSGTLTTHFGYDTRSNLEYVEDPSGRVIESEYDLASRLVARVVDVDVGPGGLELVTELGYDLDDFLTSVKDADLLTTTLAWDAQGRNTRWTYPDTTFEEMVYSPTGDLASHRARDGLLTTFTYHADRSLASRTAGNRVESFTSNALGQLLTADVAVGGTPLHALTFVYDGWNRLVSEVQPFGTVGYGYDDDDNPTSITYPDGYSLTCEYDFVNRLETVEEAVGGATLASYLWLGFDRVDERTTGDGAGTLTQAWDWDGFKRPVGMDAGSTLALGYGFDELDRRVFKDYEQPNEGGDVYRHDGASRLYEVYYGAPDPPQGNAGGDPFEIELSGADSRLSTTFQSTVVDYNGGSVDPTHRYLAVGTTTRAYDGRGNLIDDGTNGFEYDPWNRLARVTDAGGDELVRYEHDALGRRVSETVTYPSGTVVRTYAYAGPRLLRHWEGPDLGSQQPVARYVYGAGLDELVAFDDDAGARYTVLQDALGSVEMLNGWTSGALAERYAYDAFGVPSVTDGSGAPVTGGFGGPSSALGNQMWFTGARWDEASGQYHMRMRQFEPGVGQFTSMDPLRYADGPNSYAYALGDPVDWTDPYGLDVMQEHWKRAIRRLRAHRLGDVDQDDPDSLLVNSLFWEIGGRPLMKDETRAQYKENSRIERDLLNKYALPALQSPLHQLHPSLFQRSSAARTIGWNNSMGSAWEEYFTVYFGPSVVVAYAAVVGGPALVGFGLRSGVPAASRWAASAGSGAAASAAAAAAMAQRIAQSASEVGRRAMSAAVNAAGRSLHAVHRALMQAQRWVGRMCPRSGNRLDVDPNKLRHIFDKAAHNLGPLVQRFGSQEAAFKAVGAATQAAVRTQGLTGIFETTVSIAGQNVVVRGNVIDGLVRIGTFFIP